MIRRTGSSWHTPSYSRRENTWTITSASLLRGRNAIDGEKPRRVSVAMPSERVHGYHRIAHRRTAVATPSWRRMTMRCVICRRERLARTVPSHGTSRRRRRFSITYCGSDDPPLVWKHDLTLECVGGQMLRCLVALHLDRERVFDAVDHIALRHPQMDHERVA